MASPIVLLGCAGRGQKRSLLFAEYLDEQLLLALPHRQFVFTLPKALRVFLRCDPRLFGQISRLIFSPIAEFYAAASGKAITTGAVLGFRPFGSALRFNPHFHALILEGGFDSQGRFYHIPIHDTARLTQFLRQRTVSLVLKLALITENFAQTILRWRHSGFSVNNSVQLDGGDHRARQALAQYLARAPLSLNSLTCDSTGGKILYHTTYGLYSSRCKAQLQSWPHLLRVAPAGWHDSHPANLPADSAPLPMPAVSRAACRSSPYGGSRFDRNGESPLLCPRCGSQMRVMAIITDPSGVRRILSHLLKIARAPPGLDPGALT